MKVSIDRDYPLMVVAEIGTATLSAARVLDDDPIELRFRLGRVYARLSRVQGWLTERGFGISTRGGCSGSTRGEPGLNMFRNVTVLLWRPYQLSITWKELGRG